MVDFTGAISSFAGNDETGWTLAGEAARKISASATLAIILLAFVDVLAPSAFFKEARITFALVAFRCVDAFPVAANVGSEGALVDGELLALRAQFSIVHCRHVFSLFSK